MMKEEDDTLLKNYIMHLKILEQGHINVIDFKGSWAGAMGQNQFMPSSFLNYAQDFNNDGKKDIWTDTEDSLASIARYLQGSRFKQMGSKLHLG